MYQPNTRQRRRAVESSLKCAENDGIDRQIAALHLAMGTKLLSSPALVEKTKSKIEERYHNGYLRHGAYLTWISLLEHIYQPDKFIENLMEDTPRMRKLRRKTPLVGILNEQERCDVIDKMTFEGTGDSQ
jgi:hypothetical protein